MIVEQEYSIKLSEINRENEATNKAILGILEDVGGIHSNIAGYGLLDIKNTHLSWVLLDWKVQIIRRPKYNEKIIAKTWSKESIKFYAYRDFEIYDTKGNVIVKAITKWVLINIQTEKLTRITPEILGKYEPELEKTVFENEDIEKVREPEKIISEVDYKVKRADIDVNNHMHNLNYLELVNEALPEEIYYGRELNNIRISYKKEIKLGETVKCQYSFENGKHIITVRSEDKKVLHSIIEVF